MAKARKLPPIHPGEILREDFMRPRGSHHAQTGLGPS
jgi:plasmid maintenance system antidote protein VapI